MRTRILLLLALSGCHGGSDNGGGASTELNANIGLDLSKVVGFVISQSAGPVGTSSVGPTDGGGAPTSELYALGSDDSLTVVTVVGAADGGATSTSQTVQPIAVFDTKAYLFLAYWGVTHSGTLCNLVTVHKTDGAMYCITDALASSQWLGQRVDYWRNFQSDGSGNVVWFAGSGLFVRYDLSDPSHPTSTRPLSAEWTGGASQAVNSDGDDLLTSFGSNSGQSFTRVMRPSGGFADVSSHEMHCISAGPSSNPNDFYYSDPVGPTTRDNQWVRLVKSPSGTFTPAVLGSMDWTDCSAGLVRTSTHFFLSGGRLSQNESNQVLDIFNGTPTTLSVGAFAGSKITRIAGYEAALFILGTDTTGSSGIVKYDIAGGSFTTLLRPGDYAVSTMDVSPGGDVTFYGQRASDGAMILGNIPAGGSTANVIATGFPPVAQIARIN